MLNRIILAYAASTAAILSIPAPAHAADDGAAIFAQACGLCHTPTRRSLENKYLTRDQWEEAIERMRGYGAPLPRAKLPELLNYLTRTHGPDRRQPMKK